MLDAAQAYILPLSPAAIRHDLLADYLLMSQAVIDETGASASQGPDRCAFTTTG